MKWLNRHKVVQIQAGIEMKIKRIKFLVSMNGTQVLSILIVNSIKDNAFYTRLERDNNVLGKGVMLNSVLLIQSCLPPALEIKDSLNRYKMNRPYQRSRKTQLST